MRDYKKTNAPESTITFDREKVQGDTENIYEAIAVIARRADQINAEIKQELIEKLDEFATHNDSLEEVFENKEQIEVSRFYERLPKPSSIAIKEWLDGDIYYRKPFKEEK